MDFSIQALEWADPQADISIAADLGKAIGAAIDAQLVAGSNASGQMLGFANVTGIKTVAWTDASPTSQEFVGQVWKAYDQIANGGQGIAGPVRVIVDDESLSGNMQVRVTAYRMLASGFGRAPAAICRLSGTGLIAPVL